MNSLTPRENEVIKLIVKGYNNKEIAETLNISISTANAHVLKIYQKFDVNNRVLAVISYITLMGLDPESLKKMFDQ